MLTYKKFGIEIPGINSLKDFESIIKLSKHYEIPITEVNEVTGSKLIPKSEKIDMLNLAFEHGIGMTFSISTRPEYSIDSAFYRSAWGKELGRRLTSEKEIKFAIDEIIKASELGCRGFIIYDAGLLSELNELRKSGYIHHKTKLKISTHCGISNFKTAKIYSNLGADDIIPSHDLSRNSLLEIRKFNPNTLLSIITDTYKNKGGFIRHNDIEFFIENLSPLLLKMGNSLEIDPYISTGSNVLENKMRRIRALLESGDVYLGRYALLESDKIPFS